MNRRNGVDIEVTGIGDFTKAARKAKDKDTLIAIKAANKVGSEIVKVKAKTLVPVGKTGKLGRSIKAGASIKRGTVSAGSAALPYAGPIHFGWATHNIEPQPFIYEAIDDRREAVWAAYDLQITKVVNSFGI